MRHKFSPGKAVRSRWRFEVALKTLSHDESSDWPTGQTDGSAAHLAGSCIPGKVTRALFLGWKQTCVKRVLFGRRGVLWQRIEGGQQACTYTLAGSPTWFSVRRWHGIERMAAMNLAAMLLAPPQHKALARKVQGIFKRLLNACGVFGFAAE